MAKEEKKSIFSLFPNYVSPLGDWEEQEKKEEKSTILKNLESVSSDIEMLGDSKKNGKANGYYFNIDGTFFGKEGNSEEIVLCSEKREYNYLSNNKKETGFLYLSPDRQSFKYKDLEVISGIIYAESSIEHINEISESDMLKEAYSLGTAMVNFKFKRKHDDANKYNPTYSQLSLDMKAFGYESNNYKIFVKTKLEKRNNNHMRVCIGGGLNALLYNNEFEKKLIFKPIDNPLPFLTSYYTKYIINDFSNNAILWDGIDLTTNYDNHPKVVDGYLISDKKHNTLDIKSKKVNDQNTNEDDKKVCNNLYSIKDPKFKETKCYSYKYKTTSGYAKTMFVKLTDEYEDANINSKREIKDNTYILNRWW